MDQFDSSSGTIRDYGKTRFHEGLKELESKYPNLCNLNSSLNSKSKGKNKNKQTKDYNLVKNAIFGCVGSATSSSSTNSIIQKNFQTSSRRAPSVIDLSKSKLASLDEGAGSFTPTPRMGKRKIKAIRKKARESTKGPKWYDMTAPEVTDKRKNDLEALKLRGALDTKTFYKRNTVTTAPKYFHVGKVVETSQDFYNSRVPKKQRKNTIAEELMAELRN